MLTISLKTCSGHNDEEYRFRFNAQAATALCRRDERILTLDGVLDYAVKKLFGRRAFYQPNHEIRGYGQIFRAVGNGASSVTGRVQLDYLVNSRNVGEEVAWDEFKRLAGKHWQEPEDYEGV